MKYHKYTMKFLFLTNMDPKSNINTQQVTYKYSQEKLYQCYMFSGDR